MRRLPMPRDRRDFRGLFDIRLADPELGQDQMGRQLQWPKAPLGGSGYIGSSKAVQPLKRGC